MTAKTTFEVILLNCSNGEGRTVMVEAAIGSDARALQAAANRNYDDCEARGVKQDDKWADIRTLDIVEVWAISE